jgi:hypothetical protein
MARLRARKGTPVPVRGRRTLKFLTQKDFEAALQRTDAFAEVPFALVGDRTLIVPDDAVPYFAGLRYKEEHRTGRQVA